MDKTYNHLKYEKNIYELWEKSRSFHPSATGKPYTILMPPPNANASLHAGHAMYTIDDVLTRFKRMQGYSALWSPGMDHAGFETQYVYEKELAKKGKSRMDFDRETLYKNIFEFVQKNSGLIYKQFRELGFSADWDRSVFTLDKNVVYYVYKTFEKMEKDGLVYRDNYIVNYCIHCGTSLAELEVKHIERKDSLYYVKYPFRNKIGHIVVATVRPEPIFADTHLAVNPKDFKNKDLIGEKVLNPLTNEEMEVIGENYVDPEFGTGIVKLTPAHDPKDFEVARKRNLPIIQAINWNGKMMENARKYKGLKVKVAREEVVKDLKEKNFIEKIDENYTHSVITCYKCGRDLEPLTVPNWFIKVVPLKKLVKESVKKDRVKFYPKKFKTQMLSWLDIMHDWPISRQIVWGIRIPVWYEVNPNASNLWVWWISKEKKLQQGNASSFLKKGIKLRDIESGLQKVYALTGSSGPNYVISDEKPKDGKIYLPETDTFDTWFSSGQWPLVALRPEKFKARFPTDFLGTLSDILKFWVSRMIMFSLYLKKEVPFKDVYLWSMVADEKGIKMSKSKGNVINPVDLVEKYGADALRFSLIYGTAAGSKVILSENKVRGMRNFANKLWNIARFIKLNCGINLKGRNKYIKNKEDELLIVKTNDLIKQVTFDIETYKFDQATSLLYEFVWHYLADIYIEKSKDRLQNNDSSAQMNLISSFTKCLKLLHPFMPFVTEVIWGEIRDLRKNPKELLITSSWPKS